MTSSTALELGISYNWIHEPFLIFFLQPLLILDTSAIGEYNTVYNTVCHCSFRVKVTYSENLLNLSNPPMSFIERMEQGPLRWREHGTRTNEDIHSSSQDKTDIYKET